MSAILAGPVLIEVMAMAGPGARTVADRPAGTPPASQARPSPSQHVAGHRPLQRRQARRRRPPPPRSAPGAPLRHYPRAQPARVRQGGQASHDRLAAKPIHGPGTYRAALLADSQMTEPLTASCRVSLTGSAFVPANSNRLPITLRYEMRFDLLTR